MAPHPVMIKDHKFTFFWTLPLTIRTPKPSLVLPFPPLLPFPPSVTFFTSYCTVLYCTILYNTVLYCTVQSPPAPGQAGRHFQSPNVDLWAGSHAPSREWMPLLLSLIRRHSYPPPPPPTAPDDAPKVVFTHSRLHMAAWLENTFERDFLFQKNGRCGMGWDGIQSPVSSHLLKRKMEVYIQNYDEKKQLNILHACRTFASV